jgi:pimeloyl-ACP methyl ester carboxylesterase
MVHTQDRERASREDLVTAENTPDPTAPDTIVLIHGFWMTPRSWEKWVEH